MPQDATFEIMAGLTQKDAAALQLIADPVWNLDDMDPRFCMVSLVFTGMYCFMSGKTIDPKRPGMIWLDGKETEAPFVPPLMPMFGQMIGFRARKYLKDYDHVYKLRYAGAYDTDGLEIPEFSFTLRTLPRQEPGKVWPEHDELVLKAARESAVLLKNENRTLPLGEYAAVNVFGAGAVVFRSGCLGAGKINPRYSIGVKEGIERYTSLKLNEELYEFYRAEQNILPAQDVLERARALSGTAVVFLSRTSSEAHDNLPEPGQYYLTDEEKGLIKALRECFPKVAAVLNVAYPIEMGWTKEVDAVLLTGLPGMAGGRALAEILEGRVNPSGKLPCTWAEDYWDYPSSRNFLTSSALHEKYPGARFVTTVYEEGLYVGYRYFDTFQKAPSFCFGHGLSYTTFEKYAEAEENRVRVRITNTGAIPGKEVAAIYAGLPQGRLEQPARRLVAFGKTRELAPGESQELCLEIPENRLGSFEEETGEWILEPGTLVYYLGEEKIAEQVIRGRRVLKKAAARIPAPLKIQELSRRNPQKTWPAGKDTRGYSQETLPFSAAREWNGENLELEKPGGLISFFQVAREPSLAEDFAAQLSDRELARLTVGGRTGWGAGDSGYAGMLYREGELERYQLPEYYFADGNNGLNLFAPNIGFPVSATMCASWDEELMYQEGCAIAEEAKERGISCLLAPALNLQRNILCGRHTEYFSEDPLLAGRMAGQECRGFEENGVSGCMKHFFANNAETLRNMNHSILSERTARELYLAAFAYAFEVKQPDTVMTGYNAANGMYCCDDPALLRGILREELGFEGYVMTDWNGYGDQGMEGLIHAGVSWIAPGSPDDTFVKPILEALEKGTLPKGVLQRNLASLVRVLAKCEK